MKYLILLVLLASCTVKTNTQRAEEEIAKSLNQGTESALIRYEDRELGVVCYRVRAYEGLSCITKNNQVPTN